MSVLIIELFVVVVADFEDTVFHAEGIGEVFSEGVSCDFYGPAVEVFSVEKRNPLGLNLVGLGCGFFREQDGR